MRCIPPPARPSSRYALLITFAAVIASGLAACAASRSGPLDNGPVYPLAMPRERTLNIQLVRQPTTVELTNTTATPIRGGWLWLNGRWGKQIGGLAIGQSLSVPLSEFRNVYNESPRGGGFFATERPDTIVLAELETDGRLLGLVVVGPPPE